MKKKVTICLIIIIIFACCSCKGNVLNSDTMVSSSGVKDKSTDELQNLLDNYADANMMIYLSENELMLLDNEIRIIDIKRGEEVKNLGDSSDYIGMLRNFPYEEGFICAYLRSEAEDMFSYGEDREVMLDYYDRTLNKVKTISVREEYNLQPSVPDDITANNNGDIAIYDSNRGLFLIRQNAETVESIITMDEYGLVNISGYKIRINDNIQFGNEETIYCLAVNLEGDNSIYGVLKINLEDRTMNFFDLGDEYTNLLVGNKYACIAQECGYTSPTGKIIRIDSKGKNGITCDDKKESGRVFLSDEGNYLCTIIEDDNLWKLRVYDVEKGEKVQDITVSDISTEEYVTDALIFEDEKTLIVWFDERSNLLQGDKYQVLDLELKNED